MTDINTVVIEGRLTKNAEFRQIGETTNAKFTIATNRSRKVNDQWEDETSFIDAQAWGRLAENMSGRLSKGTSVTISGYLKQERWESNGEKKSRHVVVADQITVHTAAKQKEQDNGNENW